MHINYL